MHRQSLIELLELPEDIKFPSYSTFRRLLLTLDFQPLTESFNSWAAEFAPPEPNEYLALDGKSIRCTLTDHSQSYQDFINVVSVFSHQRGIVLMMQPISNKQVSEVTLVQQLVAAFAGQEVCFTLDALHCQKSGCDPAPSHGARERAPSKRLNSSNLVGMTT